MTYRRSLWDDRLELSLKLLDAFDNEERKSETSEMELSGGFRNLVAYTKPDRRTFFLNIKYKFGTAGKKSKSKKPSNQKDIGINESIESNSGVYFYQIPFNL